MHTQKLIIFSKAPLAGQVKTRLIPALGRSKATQLHRYMLEQTVIMASKLKNIDCELHCAPDTSHSFFNTLANKYSLKLLPQQGAQLGDKMAYAMQAALSNCLHCVIIGTDCPTMNAHYIQQAFTQLRSADVVLGPAKDGGYVLIAAKAFDGRLFSRVSWGTSQVLKQTLKNINQLQLKYHKLNTLSDVDRAEDLAYLPSQYLLKAFS
jgi:hypothetical protein